MGKIQASWILHLTTKKIIYRIGAEATPRPSRHAANMDPANELRKIKIKVGKGGKEI